MSGLKQNGHFSVFSGYLKKVSLGNVKVDLFRPNLVRDSNLYSDENKDGFVSICDLKKFEKFCMSRFRQNGYFSVFSGYFKKVSLGNVKVDLFRPNLVINSNLVGY